MLLCAIQMPTWGGACVIWIVRVEPPSGQTCPSTMLLEVLPSFFSWCCACRRRWGDFSPVVLSFFFSTSFLSSLLRIIGWPFLFLILQVYSLVFWFLFLFFIYIKKLFIFNLVIWFQFIIYIYIYLVFILFILLCSLIFL